jgi:CubicO group peptidase (beta-lactamase class C family)
MEAISPTYEPGKVIAYHPRNFGWVIGELVRRIDGRPIQQFFEEEIKSTLNMQDTFIGLPAALEGRVSTIFAMEDCDRSAMVTTYNRPEVHQVVQPAGGGIATARDLGLFYAALAGQGVLNGQRILKPETVTEVTQLQVEGMDHSLERQVSRTLGMVLADPRMGSNGVEPNRTFGHGGAGTSVGWADPDSGLGVAYITNGFRAEQSNAQRLAAISQAVRDACR